MSYTLEKIAPAEIEKIYADADDFKRRHLKMRGGYFIDGLDYFWAIDRSKDQYFLIAPKFRVMSSHSCFYFKFQSYLYALRIEGYSNPLVLLDDRPSSDVINDFIAELKTAFQVHGFTGHPEREPKVSTIFPEEGGDFDLRSSDGDC